jgi:dienelactone hydrolase
LGLKTASPAYTHGEQPLTGYVVWEDDRMDRRPGVIVFHGGAGLDDHARDRARRIAGLGYVALAADLYGDGVRGNRDRVMESIRRFQGEPAYLRSRAAAGLAELAAHPLVDGRLAAVGYCLGGLAALELARSGASLAAAASIHGSLHTAQPAEPGVISARLLVCHGALDPHVPMSQLQEFIQEMTRAGADWQLNVYGGAMHGFTHDPAGPSQPGVAYHAVADARSSAALSELLTEAFRLA